MPAQPKAKTESATNKTKHPKRGRQVPIIDQMDASGPLPLARYQGTKASNTGPFRRER